MSKSILEKTIKKDVSTLIEKTVQLSFADILQIGNSEFGNIIELSLKNYCENYLSELSSFIYLSKIMPDENALADVSMDIDKLKEMFIEAIKANCKCRYAFLTDLEKARDNIYYFKLSIEVDDDDDTIRILVMPVSFKELRVKEEDVLLMRTSMYKTLDNIANIITENEKYYNIFFADIGEDDTELTVKFKKTKKIIKLKLRKE